MADAKSETADAALARVGKVGAFAPGTYECECFECKRPFIGDKRAFNCLPCAVALLNSKLDTYDHVTKTVTQGLSAAQRALLHDKVALWSRSSKEGVMDLRDYNARAADALRTALAICAAVMPKKG